MPPPDTPKRGSLKFSKPQTLKHHRGFGARLGFEFRVYLDPRENLIFRAPYYEFLVEVLKRVGSSGSRYVLTLTLAL